MKVQRFHNTFAVRLDIGDEVVDSLKKLADTEQIRLAEISAIGAADHAVMGVFDRELSTYRQEELNRFMEITSLMGNITEMEGKPYIHLHATLADQDHGIHGGHVIEMHIGLTCEMFVRVMEGAIGREHSDELGINLWKL